MVYTKKVSGGADCSRLISKNLRPGRDTKDIFFWANLCLPETMLPRYLLLAACSRSVSLRTTTQVPPRTGAPRGSAA